jgi:hypothetical protein
MRNVFVESDDGFDIFGREVGTDVNSLICNDHRRRTRRDGDRFRDATSVGLAARASGTANSAA